jgi:hypothetical protein
MYSSRFSTSGVLVLAANDDGYASDSTVTLAHASDDHFPPLFPSPVCG